MSRWFRHYAGMMRDEKLVRVAVRAKQPVERVVWVWGAILESAAEINDGGRYDFDADEAAYFLRCDATELGAVIDALNDLGRLHAGSVAHWGERQFDSDASRERQKRYRERHKGTDERNADAVSDVTPPSRDAEVTLQETETETELDTEKEEQKEPRTRRDVSEFRSELSDLDTERLDAIVKHRRSKRGQLTGHAARLFRQDAAACSLTLPEAVDACISRNWITVKPEYFASRARAGPQSAKVTTLDVGKRLLSELEAANARTNPETGGHQQTPRLLSAG